MRTRWSMKNASLICRCAHLGADRSGYCCWRCSRTLFVDSASRTRLRSRIVLVMCISITLRRIKDCRWLASTGSPIYVYPWDPVEANHLQSLILRRVIEMHITSTILERSLVLDAESTNKVREHLQQQYPERSAPRCAQRQIKLAFFMLQRVRIKEVLKDWGNRMWMIKGSAYNQIE